MLHLAQAWNVLSAIGGTPWYGRPNLPQPSSYYPLDLPLETRPFSLATVERFIEFERPTPPGEPPPPVVGDDARNYRSVGQLYRLIRMGIEALPERELFIGDPRNQVGPELMDFPDLVPVYNRASAVKGIDTIIEQGEGSSPEAKDSHYQIFRRVRISLLEETLAGEAVGRPFQPARPCIWNPIAYPRADRASPGSTPILDPRTAAAADLFDSVYVFMLRLLQYVFDPATNDAKLLRTFSVAALQLMTTVIKPFGEALAMMPAGEEAYGEATAGAPFSVGRHVALPVDPPAAHRVASEKLVQLTGRLRRLVGGGAVPPQLSSAAQRLSEIQI